MFTYLYLTDQKCESEADLETYLCLFSSFYKLRTLLSCSCLSFSLWIPLLCFWLNNIKSYFKEWSQQLKNTSDLCGRNLKHSFPALIDCSCSSSLKCASAKAWYAAVNIDTSWPESERWMHMLRSMTAFLWFPLSTALRPRWSHCFGWPYKKWWCISVVMAQVLDPSWARYFLYIIFSVGSNGWWVVCFVLLHVPLYLYIFHAQQCTKGQLGFLTTSQLKGISSFPLQPIEEVFYILSNHRARHLVAGDGKQDCVNPRHWTQWGDPREHMRRHVRNILLWLPYSLLNQETKILVSSTHSSLMPL